MYAVEIDDAAAAELRQIAADYELAQEGLGRRFLREAIRTRRAIDEMPRRFGRLRGFAPELEIRRALCDGFPYALIFVVIENRKALRILAVAHARREPSYWVHRLRDEDT